MFVSPVGRACNEILLISALIICLFSQKPELEESMKAYCWIPKGQKKNLLDSQQLYGFGIAVVFVREKFLEHSQKTVNVYSIKEFSVD